MDDEVHLIGDIVLCAPVIEKEALEQSKNLRPTTLILLFMAHFIYMVTTMKTKDADIMEAKEIKILTGLGYKNPYLIEESKSQ